MAPPSHTTTSSILVLVVRHGERQDEVEHHVYKKESKQDRIDPKLTSSGYQLAASTWRKIKDMLVEANLTDDVCVFSSPLRRAVGTAMMLSVVNENAISSSPPSSNTKTTSINFTVPFANTSPSSSSSPQSSSSAGESAVIPIVILNGLCNCTALALRMGGFKNLVRTGYLHCAAIKTTDKRTVSTNDGDEGHNNNTIDNPIAWEEFKNLRKIIRQTALIEDDNNVTHPSEPSTFADCDLQSIQLWMVGENEYSPMTPQLNWQEDKILNSTPDETVNNNSKKKPHHIHHEPLPSESSIDHAVRMAIDAGRKVVLVSSHREEIRDLARERCHYHQRFHTPYCSVGQFEVTVASNADGDEVENEIRSGKTTTSTAPLQWICHNICPPEELDAQSISKMAFAGEQLSHLVASDEEKQRWTMSDAIIDIEWPVIERTMLSLCTARLILDQSATNYSIDCIRSCKLNGAQQAGQPINEEKESNQVPVVLKFHIHDGHHSWLKFLRRLDKDIAFGDMLIELSNGEEKTVRAILRPSLQPTLPCPPTTILFEIYL
mmetsp:Transcript_30236/g.73540  ORF Transcript_30236/g.73540 Transcript_30236/m.73540 type:complete len:548 (+) Transcript_30236:2214-3857(+)